MEIDLTQLTPKQQLFCDEYLTDMNATRAALRAGYSQATALNGALMRKPKIRAHLERRTEEMKKRCPVSVEMLLAELTRIAFGNMGNYFGDDGKLKPMDRLSDDEKAALWYVKTTDDGTANVKMYNKLAAIEKIAKLLRYYEPQVVEPMPNYVYLDKKDICADDRFEDPTFDAPELPFTEPVEFADEEGNVLYNGPIPYGEMADVYRFDMHETPYEMRIKLTLYDAVNTEIRPRLNDWLERELVKCGHVMTGDSIEEVYQKFRMLRLLRRAGRNAVAA